MSNLRAHLTFITILLAFCCFPALSAIASSDRLPATLHELLQSNTPDLSAVVSELKDIDLPAALAVAEILKFKALHQDTAITAEQINKFELLIKDRLADSSIVSFSETETCRNKVKSHEVEAGGYKITVPEYYTANIGLAITDIFPLGEAGTVFPDIQINFISQSPIVEYRLNIDGNIVPDNKINVFDDGETRGLIFRPDLNADSILAIGTHTAEIIISNEKGDQTKKQWAFTVGVYNMPTPPLPDGAKVVTELQISPTTALPGCKIRGELFVIVYQDNAGRRYTSYRLVSPSGTVMQTRNLAFIARILNSNRSDIPGLHILPRLSYAFVGNQITFSYEYNFSPPGEIIEEKWKINSGGQAYSEPTIIFLGDTSVTCEVLAKYPYNHSGGQDSYLVTHTDYKEISAFIIKSYMYDSVYNTNRAFHIGEGEREFPLSGRVTIENGIWGNLTEGGEYFDGNGVGGILTADKLRWGLLKSEGSPQIKNAVASQAAVIFTKPGFAEVAFEVELTWKQDGQIFKSSFKPNTSGLYAFYPATGNVEFNIFHPAQLSTTQRLLEIRNFSIEINGEKRLIESESGWKFAQPLILCRSTIDPASYPLSVVNAWPAILSSPTSGYPNGRPLTQNSIFKYLTLSTNAGVMPLRLFCEFQPYNGYVNSSKLSFVKDLPSITVYNSADVMETILHPAELSSVQEGQQEAFNAEVRPKSGFGEGSLSLTAKNLNILDGYRFATLKYVRWRDRALFPTDNQAALVETKELVHDFRPQSGTGKYSLDCGINFDLKDSETNKTSNRGISTYHPIEVTPGLRILSPIDKLAYPLNRTIKVTTTMDAEEHVDQWKLIEWKLNGEKFVPPGEKPAFPLFLNKIGKWKLEAQLKTQNPNTGEKVTLYDSSEFEVKQLEVSMTPARRVLDFNKQSSAELQVSVLVNGNKIEKPGDAVPWQTTDTKIIVDSVNWQLVALPDDSAKIDLIPQSFKADCKFHQLSAATAIATITVRITGAKELFDKKHKGFKDKFEEQIFEIPVGRADLWAVKPGAITKEEKHFPEKSIAEAYSTYKVTSFEFDFESGTESKESHFYTAKDGLIKPISLKPALPGIESLMASINLKWQVNSAKKIEQNLAEPTRMVIKPTEVCAYKIATEVDLDFGCSALKVGEISTSANAVDLFTLIETKVDPSSFTITLGETKTLKYIVSSLEPVIGNGSPGSGDSAGFVNATDESKTIYLLDKSYALTIENVEWSDNQDSQQPPTPAKNSIESNPYNFQANKSGNVKGQAKGVLRLSEILNFENNEIGQSSGFDSIALWNTRIVLPILQILINNEPVGQQEYYLGQKITLSYRLGDNSNKFDRLENPSWQISGPNLKNYNPFVTGKKQATFTSNEDLTSDAVSLFLYCIESETFEKQIVIRGTFFQEKLFASASIKIEHPILADLAPPKIATPTFNFFMDGSDKVFYVGYKSGVDKPVVFDPTIENDTKIEYLISALQLVRNNHWRKSVVNGLNIEEIAVTKPLDEMWLDAHFFYINFDKCAPKSITKTKQIYIDAPIVDLDDAFPKIVTEVRADAEYILFFMVKPSGNAMPYNDSIWVPIKAFSWKWQGQALKNNDGVWNDIPNSLIAKGFVPLDYNQIVEWTKVALSKEDEELADENHILIKWELKP